MTVKKIYKKISEIKYPLLTRVSGFGVHIYLCCGKNEVRDFEKELGEGEIFFEETLNNSAGAANSFTSFGGEKIIVIYINDEEIESPIYLLGTIAHEVFHCVSFIAKDIRYDMVNEQEPAAYLIGDLVRMVLKDIQRRGVDFNNIVKKG